MAISKIQYDDKVAINIDSTIPDINKCNASDLNEIKSVVNNNADEIPTISDEYGTSTTDGYSQNYINENTINPSGEPSTSEEDVSSATFTNTLEAPMEIDLKGNTLQNGTPTPSSPIPINNVSGDNDIVVCGKNLWRFLSTNYYNNQNISSWNILSLDKLELTSTNGTYANVKYKLNLPNGTYTFKLGKVTNTNSNMTKKRMTLAQYIGANISVIQHMDEGNSYTINIDNSQNDFYCIEFWATYETAMINTATFEEIQIEKGSTATTYEAYNGTTYNIDLPVENLFDKDNVNVINAYFNSTTPTISQDVGSRTIYIPCKPNTTYTISKIITNRFAIGYTTTTPALNVSVSGVIQNNSSNAITITTGNNATHLVVFMWISTDTKTYTEVRDTLQIEYGTKANSYTPYGTTPIELNKIGTYQDYIYKENDKWYLHKEIGKYTFTGEETFTLQNSNKRAHILNTNNQLGDILKTTGGTGILYGMYCNKLEEKTANQTWTGTQGISYDYNSGANQEDIDISINGLTTIDQYKSAINGITMHFILNTPTNTEITYTPLIEQLESIKNAMSKEGTTNVNQVNNDAPFMLDLSVFNDTYNGRYEGLKEQIPNNDNLVNVGTYVNDNYKVNMLYSHNLFDGTLYNGIINQSGTYISNANRITNANSTTMKTFILKKGTYTLSIDGLDACTIVLKNESGSVIQEFADSWKTLPFTFTTTNDGYFYFSAKKNDDSALTPSDYKLMLNEGGTALPYEPYIVPSINVDGEEIYNKPVVLWTNSNPSTTFNAQDINISNLSDFNYYEVSYKIHASQLNYYQTTGKIPRGINTCIGGGYARPNNTPRFYSRYVEYSSTKLTFSNGYYSLNFNDNANTANDILVPYQIIGYK